MKVFLTGATGVLGKRVAPLLIANNHEVVALSRSDSNFEQFIKMGVEPVVGDIFNQNDMLVATRGVDAIFHLATHIPKVAVPSKPSHWLENDKIRTVGTRTLLTAARMNNIKMFIQQSVTMLYSDKQGGWVSAETPISTEPISMVHSAIEMEKLIREEKGLGHIILRFGSFYGADTFNTQSLIEQMKKSRMPIIGNGDNFLNFIHVDDAALAILYAFQNFERLRNRTLNFTDFSPILSRNFVHGMVKLTGGKKPITIPGFMARILLGKNLYHFLTDSHRIKQDELISDWKPKNKTYWEGMKDNLY